MTSRRPPSVKLGLMLSNRGPVLGYASARELVELGVRAEQSGYFDSVWSGDAFLVNPRLDAINLLSAVAARTERVMLGPACMGSFTQRGVLDLAYGWASLDQLAGGRSVMVACVGGGSPQSWARESGATGVATTNRREVMWERIELLRQLWSEDTVTFAGKHHEVAGVTVEPKPVRVPYPIWAATNITRLSSGTAEGKLPTKTLASVGRLCDGWMTHSVTPDRFTDAWAHIESAAQATGKDPTQLDNCLCLNVCMHDDPDVALDESVAFLKAYYGIEFTRERTRAWTLHGPPSAIAAGLADLEGSAIKRVALRITSNDQSGQLERLIEKVLPQLGPAA